jgi:rhamnogalacturonan acetylesterase
MQVTHSAIRVFAYAFSMPLIASFLVSCGTTGKPTVSKVAEANQTAAMLKSSPPARSIPALLIIGDSTVHNTGAGLKGWGDVIAQHFDTNRIVVQNHALGGRSSRTFQTQGWWAKTLAASQPGDFLLIQFGHNDTSPINDTNRARGTLPGLGEEATNIVNGLTLQPETVHTYGWYLRGYIAEARKRGVTPIVCSPVPRLPQPGKEQDVTRYIGWARDVAAEQAVAFIDLNSLIMTRYAGLSSDEIKTNYFTPKDSTHFNPVGAELNADCVVSGIRRLTNCALKDYLLDQHSPAEKPAVK